VDAIVARLSGRAPPAVFDFFLEAENRYGSIDRHGLLAQCNTIAGLRLLAGLAGGLLDFVQELMDGALVVRGVGKNAPHEIARRQDPILVRRVRIGFAENANAVPQAEVMQSKARRRRHGLPARAVTGEIAVKERLPAAELFQAPAYIGEKFVAHRGDYLRVARDVARPLVGNRVTMKRSVGRVAINDDGRIPLIEEPNQAPYLGAFQFDEIAIEVETLGVLANAHSFDRPDLARPIGLGEVLVAIGIEDRREDQAEILKEGPV